MFCGNVSIMTLFSFYLDDGKERCNADDDGEDESVDGQTIGARDFFDHSSFYILMITILVLYSNFEKSAGD